MKWFWLLIFIPGSLLAQSCSKDDLFCISNSYSDQPSSTPGNNQVLGKGIQSGIAGYSETGRLLDQSAAERQWRFAPSMSPIGFSRQQVENIRQQQQRNFQRQHEDFERKAQETSPETEKAGELFQEQISAQRSIIEALRKIKVNKPIFNQPEPAETREPFQEPEGLSTHRLSYEGKSVRQTILNAQTLVDASRRDFVIRSAYTADQLFSRSTYETRRIAQRWLERAQTAHIYWSDQPRKAEFMRESLSAKAQDYFGLKPISADTFERYEIIQAAKMLSFENKLLEHEELRLQAALALQQAVIHAEAGETNLVVQMTENAYAIKDFLKGFVGGIKQNIFDTATGLWHTIMHPVDSAEALYEALVNYDKTFDTIKASLEDVWQNYDSYSIEEKGQLHGKIASEILLAAFPAGSLKNVAKVSKSVEKIVADTRKLSRIGQHIQAPKTLRAFPDLRKVGSKTSVQGGGKLRRRWKDTKGKIYEWDHQHGTVEVYNKRGHHLGEFDPEIGNMIKQADKTRKVEP